MQDVINLKDQLPTLTNSFIEPMIRDLKKGDCHNQLIVGKPFIGKSNFGFMCCMRTDPEFRDYIQERCTFTLRQTVDEIRAKNYHGFRAIFFDEIGDPLGSRTSMTGEQRRYVVLKQADRVKQLLMSQTIPYAIMADKSIRMLSHSLNEIMTKNETTNMQQLKIKINTFKLNWKTKEPIFRFPVAKSQGRIKRITTMWCGKAPAKEWKIYDKLKKENLERIIDKVIEDDKKGTEYLSDDVITEKLREAIRGNPELYVLMYGKQSVKRNKFYIDTDMARYYLNEHNMPTADKQLGRIVGQLAIEVFMSKLPHPQSAIQ